MSKENLFKHISVSDNELGFGKYFTDQMFSMNWTEKLGWHNKKIDQLENISLHPASLVLHYGQAIFEGMKAYYLNEKSFSLFRPEMNIDRFNKSAQRLVMPTVPFCVFTEALTSLIKQQHSWIPKTRGCSLYIRPTMIATESQLGVRPSSSYLFYILLSPVGPYFKTGFNPISIFVTDKFSRAAEGGVGNTKTIGNYAASLYAGKEASLRGCSQVLWLDAKHHKYIEEVGAMNIFFVYKKGTIVTPPLTGTILPGVTRDSVLKLANYLGYKTQEKRLSIHKVMQDIACGKITEIFGSGTAAVITPVSELIFNSTKVGTGHSTTGPITRKLYDELTAIQYGEKKDPFEWVKKIDIQ